MLTFATAPWLVRLTAGYLILGAEFSIPFALRWAGRLDPIIAGASPDSMRVKLVIGSADKSPTGDRGAVPSGKAARTWAMSSSPLRNAETQSLSNRTPAFSWRKLHA